MRSASRPPIVVDPPTTVPQYLAQRLDRDPRSPMIALPDGNGGWNTLSTTETFVEVNALAAGLVALGLKQGDFVGIIGPTSWNWSRVDMALMTIGAVSVPIYETSSDDQIRWIADDCSFAAVLADTQKQADVIVHALGEEAIGKLPLGMRLMATGGLDDIAAQASPADHEEVTRRRDALTGDDLATVIYTSGTTGHPKGVELTHANFAITTSNTATELWWICGPGTRVVMFLPLAHSLARMVNIMAMGSDAFVAYAPSPATLLEDFQSFRPTFALLVPRVFEKIYNSAEQSTGGGLKLKLFRWAAKVAIVSSREQDSRGGLSKRRKVQLAIGRRLVYRKLLTKMGGNLSVAISGGAPLGERLAHFFRGIGLRVLEGYGLTECTAPTSFNRGDAKLGTVGHPLPTTEIGVDDDGEVLIRGPHLFRGYRHNPEATAACFTDDGWLRTGDLGVLDDNGCLTITGRRKELIVTAAGKNVSPAILEDRLRGHPLVSQCVVVGDARPFIGVLITLDAEMLPGWLSAHGKTPLTLAEALTDPDIRTSLERGIERANLAVSRAESIRFLRLLDTDFTEDNGYLTPSLKVKRSLVLRDFAQDIDALYEEAAARRAHGG